MSRDRFLVLSLVIAFVIVLFIKPKPQKSKSKLVTPAKKELPNKLYK